MKNKFLLIPSLTLILIVFSMDSCQKKDVVVVSGHIDNPDGKPEVGVTIEINSVTVDEKGVKVETTTSETDDKGNFQEPKVLKADKYVINISKPGYAFVSKVFYFPVTDLDFSLTAATVVDADPTQEINAQDNIVRCVDPLDSSSINFKNAFSKVPLVYDGNGNLVGFELPEELRLAYTTLSHEKLCATGARVVIPADGLVDDDGQTPTGNIQLNISTVNLYTPDGMPGDNTVDIGNRRGYMVSSGAMGVDAFYKGKPLKLNGKRPATIIIPVDSSRLYGKKQTLADTIPFLVYNRKTGEWKKEGVARLNLEKGGYEKQVTHFSEFNLDFIFSGGTCLRVDTSPLGGTVTAAAGYKLKIIAPIPGMPAGSFDMKEIPIVNPGTCGTFPGHHAILRLYENTPIGIILCQDPPGGGDRIYFGNYVVYTQSSASSSGAASLLCANYGDCYPKPNGIPISEVLSPKPFLIKLPTTTPTSNALAWAFQFADNVNNQIRVEEAYCDNCPSGSPTFGAYSIVLDAPVAAANPVIVDKSSFTITPASAKVKYKVSICEDFTAGTCNSTWISSDELIIN